ncbi:MAG: cytochrome P450 [Steroidobacteraceae bacterium]
MNQTEQSDIEPLETEAEDSAAPVASHAGPPPEATPPFDIGASDDSLARMTELFARPGDKSGVYPPARMGHVYVIHHPDDVKRVLVSNHRNYRKGLGLDRVKILLGNGIMTSEGEFWRRQRYMLQPLFHRRIITRFAETIAAANDELVARWAPLAQRGESVNISDETSEMTLSIVLQSIFGSDLQRLIEELGENPFAVVARETHRDLRFAYRFRSLGRHIVDLVQRRHAEPAEHFDYLAMLMNARDKESGDAMSEKELVDEVMTLIVAGHETTASALNWTWYLIARHPEVERRLHASLDAAPAYESLQLLQAEELGYARQVCDESLRLYPPGWLLSRRTLAADVLGGYEVPAGTDVLLAPYLLHRHPRYWQDPERFLPERFDAAHEAERPRFAYMPFAAGPRHCIGETVAIYEMLVHLYKVARRYRLVLESDAPVEREAQVNLRTRQPLIMRLELR